MVNLTPFSLPEQGQITHTHTVLVAELGINLVIVTVSGWLSALAFKKPEIQMGTSLAVSMEHGTPTPEVPHPIAKQQCWLPATATRRSETCNHLWLVHQELSLLWLYTSWISAYNRGTVLWLRQTGIILTIISAPLKEQAGRDRPPCAISFHYIYGDLSLWETPCETQHRDVVLMFSTYGSQLEIEMSCSFVQAFLFSELLGEPRPHHLCSHWRHRFFFSILCYLFVLKIILCSFGCP